MILPRYSVKVQDKTIPTMKCRIWPGDKLEKVSMKAAIAMIDSSRNIIKDTETAETTCLFLFSRLSMLVKDSGLLIGIFLSP